MSNIVGIIDYQKKSTQDLLKAMTDTLHHRGPNEVDMNSGKFKISFSQGKNDDRKIWTLLMFQWYKKI